MTYSKSRLATALFTAAQRCPSIRWALRKPW